MNPLMAVCVDYMRKNKDLKGLQRLLQEARELQSTFIRRKRIRYMDGVILIIKKTIQEVEGSELK